MKAYWPVARERGLENQNIREDNDIDKRVVNKRTLYNISHTTRDTSNLSLE